MKFIKLSNRNMSITNFKKAKEILNKKKIDVCLKDKHIKINTSNANTNETFQMMVKRIRVLFGFVLTITIMIFFGIFLSYTTRPIIPIDIAANNFGYICEDVTDVINLGDKNATAYLVGKDADSINENFLQYIEFSTNTYAGAYYKEQKSIMSDMAKLSERKYSEKEEINGNNYRYTISFIDNKEQYVLIVDGKRFAYLIINGESYQENFKNILLQIRLREY